MLTLMPTTQVQAPAPDEGLTFAQVLGNLPHDPATIFVLVLLVLSLGAIFWIGRSRGPRPDGDGE